MNNQSHKTIIVWARHFSLDPTAKKNNNYEQPSQSGTLFIQRLPDLLAKKRLTPEVIFCATVGKNGSSTDRCVNTVSAFPTIIKKILFNNINEVLKQSRTYKTILICYTKESLMQLSKNAFPFFYPENSDSLYEKMIVTEYDGQTFEKLSSMATGDYAQ